MKQATDHASKQALVPRAASVNTCCKMYINLYICTSKYSHHGKITYLRHTLSDTCSFQLFWKSHFINTVNQNYSAPVSSCMCYKLSQWTWKWKTNFSQTLTNVHQYNKNLTYCKAVTTLWNFTRKSLKRSMCMLKYTVTDNSHTQNCWNWHISSISASASIRRRGSSSNWNTWQMTTLYIISKWKHGVKISKSHIHIWNKSANNYDTVHWNSYTHM